MKIIVYRLIMLFLILFGTSCSNDNFEIEEFIVPDDVIEMPNTINRDVYSKSHFTVNNETYYKNYFIATVSDVDGTYNEDADWEPEPDIAKFDYFGNSTKMRFYENLLENKTQYDSINGLLYDVSDINKDGKNDYLLNYWGEGLYGSWFFPNYLVSAVSNGNSYNYTIVEDLTEDTHRGVYYSQIYFDFDGDGYDDIKAGNMSNHYFRNNGDNTFTKVINSDLYLSPGNLIKMDYDGDGVLDLVVFQKSNNHIDIQTTEPHLTIFKGGSNILRTDIKIPWDFDSIDEIEDFKVADINNDGTDDLLFITSDQDGHNVNGQFVRTGYFKILINDGSAFLDKSDDYISGYNKYFDILNGESCKFIISDYDSDGDDDIFFPFYIERGDSNFYKIYYENENGKFIKKERK